MRATLALIIVCVAVFAYEALLAPDSFFDDYGFSGKNLLSKPYVLVTSIFIHGDIVHILSNIAVLFFFGVAVESELGVKKMLLIFFLGAFAGDLFSLLIYPFDAVSIGASGGVFALIGVGMIVKPMDFSLYPFFLPVPLALLGMIYTIYNAVGFFTGPSNISYIAHFGGLLVGLAFGIQKEGWRRSIVVVAVTFVILLLVPALWLLLTHFG